MKSQAHDHHLRHQRGVALQLLVLNKFSTNINPSITGPNIHPSISRQGRRLAAATTTTERPFLPPTGKHVCQLIVSVNNLKSSKRPRLLCKRKSSIIILGLSSLDLYLDICRRCARSLSISQ